MGLCLELCVRVAILHKKLKACSHNFLQCWRQWRVLDRVYPVMVSICRGGSMVFQQWCWWHLWYNLRWCEKSVFFLGWNWWSLWEGWRQSTWMIRLHSGSANSLLQFLLNRHGCCSFLYSMSSPPLFANCRGLNWWALLGLWNAMRLVHRCAMRGCINSHVVLSPWLTCLLHALNWWRPTKGKKNAPICKLCQSQRLHQSSYLSCQPSTSTSP